jgi:hypothetical protein
MEMRVRFVPLLREQYFNCMKQILTSQSGQLLIEMLLAIAGAVVVLGIGSQLVYTSLVANKAAGDVNAETGLINETLNGVDGAITEKWHNVYNLSKGTTAYFPTTTAGRWVVTTGTESVSVNNNVYLRSFTVQNVCRSSSTITGVTDSGGLLTTCATNGGLFDPSIQQITVSISATSTNPQSATKLFSRWRNLTCQQNAWLTTSEATTTCDGSTVYSAETGLSTSTGLQL